MDTHKFFVEKLLESGLSQKALGELLGKSQGWVSAVLAGEYKDIKWQEGVAIRALYKSRCQAAA